MTLKIVHWQLAQCVGNGAGKIGSVKIVHLTQEAMILSVILKIRNKNKNGLHFQNFSGNTFLLRSSHLSKNLTLDPVILPIKLFEEISKKCPYFI